MGSISNLPTLSICRKFIKREKYGENVNITFFIGVSGEMGSVGYPIRHKGGGKIREKHQKTFLRHNQGNNA